MRILTWNIQGGGGKRIGEICTHLKNHNADVIGLTEFQLKNEAELKSKLQSLSYSYILTSNPGPKQNGLLLASRYEFMGTGAFSTHDPERWLSVHIPSSNVELLLVHIPGAPDNKFQGGYGISGEKRKQLLWEQVLGHAQENRGKRAVIMGDFNTGLKIDAEGAPFKQSHYMQNLINEGYIDVWRDINPDKRDYTYYSKRKIKETGETVDHNGFRLDYIFVAPVLQNKIKNVEILHQPRKEKASDHAIVMAEFELGA